MAILCSSTVVNKRIELHNSLAKIMKTMLVNEIEKKKKV